MPSIKPFKGILYNKDKIKDIAKVVAPPYDVISPKMQDELYKKNESNIVKLILGKINKGDDERNNRYTRAAAYFNSWLNSGILKKDSEPAIYIYSQNYKYADRPIERIGFISLMKLALDDKKILPHENTLKAPKEDRLQLMRSVRANLCPIFMLYEDDKSMISALLKNFCARTRSFIDITVEGVRHRAWKFSDSKAIARIEKTVSNKDIFIADGHHRYETSKNYAREVENSSAPQSLKDSSKFFMAYFVSLDEGSLTILPTHRLIRDMGSLKKDEIAEKLKAHFVIEKAPGAKSLLSRLKALEACHGFGMYLGRNRYYVIRLKSFKKAASLMGSASDDWKSLDVSILHLFVMKYILGVRDEDDNIEFIKDADEAFKAVDENRCALAFILNPTRAAQVKNVALRGEKMPRKATYFYPKPLSGLVINKF